MMRKFLKNKSGFTLIELLVAIAIFTSLSSYLVINYSGNEKLRLLKEQAQEIVSGLEKAQNMALTGEIIDSAVPLSYRFSIGNCNQVDCSYKLSAVLATEPLNESIISETVLKAVAIENVPSGGLKVDFSAPRGKMSITNGNINLDTASFELTYDGYVYCLKLNAVSGRINSVFGICE